MELKHKHPIIFNQQELKSYKGSNYLKEFPTLFDETQINVKHHKLILSILDAKGKVNSHKKYSPHFLIWLREQKVPFLCFKHKQVYSIVLRTIKERDILSFQEKFNI